jgi:putative endonuclease
MAARNVFVFYSPNLDDYYFGESDEFMDKLNKLNTGYYDTLKAIAKASDWEIKLVIECESKSQAVKVLKHLSAKPNRLYLNNLSNHPGLVKRLLERFADDSPKDKSFSVDLSTAETVKI